MLTAERDPLAGRREAINADTMHRLVWADLGHGCPVKVGETYELRACWIEITRIQRKREGGQMVWTANFTRYGRVQAKLWLLGPKGYVHQPREAIKAQDADAPTIDAISPFDETEKHRAAGEAPEPEAIPPTEVKSLPASVAARLQYETIHQDDIARRMRRSLVEDIRQARFSPEQLVRLREFVDSLDQEQMAA